MVSDVVCVVRTYTGDLDGLSCHAYRHCCHVMRIGIAECTQNPDRCGSRVADMGCRIWHKQS